MSKKAYDFLNPVGTVPELVEGRYGSPRHAAMIREDNPYLDDLRMAIKNQDKDAAFERAVEWDADVASRHMQIAENKEILDEQRWYDSPEQQLARDRAAGINSDLAGSSGGSGSSGSSAQLTNPGLPDVQAQTKFDNKYDNTALTLQGINTGINFIGTLSSGVSSIMQAVTAMNLAPSQSLLNEANAGLASAQANETKELLAGRKKSLDLSNLNNYLGAVNTLSGLVVPGTDDEGMQNILGSAGISAEAMPGYMAAIRQVHKDPGILADYNTKQLAKRWTDAENATYTDEVVSGMTELGYQVAFEQKQLDFHQSQLQRKISQLLNEDKDFAGDSADVVMKSLTVESQGLDVQSEAFQLKLQEIRHDTEVFLEALQARADTMVATDEVISHLKTIAGKRSLTPEEVALMNKAKASKIALRTMYSSQFYQLKNQWLDVSHTLYERYHRLNDKGELRPASALEVANMFSDDTFNDLIHHTRTPGEIANAWFDSSVKAVGVAAEFTKAGLIYKGVSNLGPGVPSGNTLLTPTAKDYSDFNRMPPFFINKF